MTSQANVSVQRKAFPLSLAELVRFLAAAAATILVMAAVFVAWRRLAGAIAAPLPAAEMLFAGMLLAGLAWVARLPASRMDLRVRRVLRGRDLPVSVALIGMGVAMTVSRGNTAALVGFWTFLIGEELWGWRHLLPANLLRARNRPSSISTSVQPPSSRISGDDQEPVEPADDVQQQFTRRTTAEGAQELSGWLRMSLAAGQRSGSLHVAFCPPFVCLPEVQAELASGPSCRIKVAQSLPYGARLDIRLDAPAAEGENVLLWFVAAAQR
jgi:hypothetical protein